MSGKVKKVTITGAALIAMGVTGAPTAAADNVDGDGDSAAEIRSAPPPLPPRPAVTPRRDVKGTPPARGDQ